MLIDHINKKLSHITQTLKPFLANHDHRTMPLKSGHTLHIDSLNNWSLKNKNGGTQLAVNGPYLTSKKQQLTQKSPTHSIIHIDHNTSLTLQHKTIGDGTLSITDKIFIHQDKETALIENDLHQKITIKSTDAPPKLVGHLVDIINHLPQSFSPKNGDPVYNREILSKNYGKHPKESVDKKLSHLESTLKNDRRYYLIQVAKNILNPSKSHYYLDLVNATTDDLQDLKEAKKGKRSEKISAYNRISHEFELETTYNINLTSKGMEWSETDLNTLGDQLDNLPKKFTKNDPNLHTIEMAKQEPGVGGYNTGDGFISIAKGGVKHAIIHEIGHDFDNENPKWSDFLSLSGWQDVTSQFQSISSDDINGTYAPYSGTALLKTDGNIYKDGDKVDLNGDGKTDGKIQVHYGKVMVVNESASFITQYASSNPYDDFAETFKMFFTDTASANLLKKTCPEKFQFMVDYTGVDPLNIKSKSKIQA